MRKPSTLSALLLASAVLSGCASNMFNCAVGGALAGAATGVAIGGSAEGRILGGVLGGATGAVIGGVVCNAMGAQAATTGIDVDVDGVADNADDCPGTPTGMTVDARGCPPDADGDGVADALDLCPATAAGTAVDTSGCPVPLDADGDGVADGADRCPNTPAGVPVDANGCGYDTDADGVADYLDNCPSTPVDARVDANGCSEVGETLVRLQNVNFDFDKATLRPDSLPILDSAGNILRNNPTIMVLVEGHTDSKGSNDYNQQLSERRASSVRDYLVSRGIEAVRMIPVGRGEESPITGNDTKEGRALNRRVEFVVTRK